MVAINFGKTIPSRRGDIYFFYPTKPGLTSGWLSLSGVIRHYIFRRRQNVSNANNSPMKTTWAWLTCGSLPKVTGPCRGSFTSR